MAKKPEDTQEAPEAPKGRDLKQPKRETAEALPDAVGKDDKEKRKAKPASFKKGAKYMVAEGKSVSCKRSIVKPGQVVAAKDFHDGEAGLERLVVARVLVPAEG